MDGQSWRGVAVAVGLYVAAFAVLVVTGRTRQPWVVVLSALLLLAAAAMANATARRMRSLNQGAPLLRLAVLIAIVVIALVLAWFLYATRSLDGASLFCLCVAFIATGHVIGELRARPGRMAVHSLLLGLCAVAVVGGLRLALDRPVAGLFLAAVGLLAGPIGLSLLSHDVLERGLVRPLPFAIAGTVAVGVAVAAWLPAAGMPVFFSSRLALVLVVLVLAVAANTQADVILVVVAIGLIWTGIPRAVDADDRLLTSPVTTNTVGSNDTVLVALGDSYMSGEGASFFYKGTNDPGTNECRRAATAYAREVLDDVAADGYGDRLAFYACSGATGSDIVDRAQHPGEPPGGAMSQSKQLEALLDIDAVVPLILVSIGGNDAGFSDIGTECLAPGNCVVRGQRWLDDLQRVAQRVDEAYNSIRSVAGNDVPVLAVPYPVPINPARCGYSLLEPLEHRFLDGFVRELNKVVRKAAAEHGFLYLGAMEEVMADAGLRICDGDSKPGQLGVNFVALSDTEGLIDQLANPMNWIHNSLHPNERGHDQMTQVLASWMEARRQVDALPDDPGSDLYQVRTLPQIMGNDFDADYCGKDGAQVDGCDLSSTGWALAETARFLLGILLPGALLLLGAWLIALAMLEAARGRIAGFLEWWDGQLFN